MSVLYDPKSRKPYIWTFILFLLIPIVIFASFYIYGEKKAQQSQEEISDRSK